MLIIENFCIRTNPIFLELLWNHQVNKTKYCNFKLIYSIRRSKSCDNNQTENITEFTKGPTVVETTTSPTGNTQQKLLQIQDSPFFEIFTEQAKNLSLEMQQELSKVFSLIQAENECSKVQHQKRNEASNRLLQKQELKRNQLLQQLNQPDTVVQDDKNTLRKTQLTPSTSENVPSRQVDGFEFPLPTPIIFHVKKERQRRLSITDAISLKKKLIFNSTNFSTIPLNREHHDSDFRIF